MKKGFFDCQKIEPINDYESFYLSFHKNRYEKTINIVEKFCKKGRLLDVGAFPFHLLYYFNKHKNYTSIGLDLNPNRNDLFIDKNKLTVHQCDIENDSFPIESKSINIVLFCETFEHLGRNPLLSLKEIRRVMSDKGYLILSTPNLYSLRNVWLFLSGKGFGDIYEEYKKAEKYGHTGHVREYSRHEIKNVLQKNDFRIIFSKFEKYDIPDQKLIKKYSLKFLLLLFPFLKPQQVIVCQKND